MPQANNDAPAVDDNIDPDQLDWWAAYLNTTTAQLNRAFAEVGHKVGPVRRYLAEHQHGRSGRGVQSILPHLHQQAQAQTRPADLEDELHRNDSVWPKNGDTEGGA